MADLTDEPAEAQPVIHLNDTTIATLTEQAIVIMRLLAVVIGSLGTVLAFMETRDLVGLILYFKTTEGAGVLAAAGALGTAGVGLWRTYVKRRVTMVAGKAAPDSKVVVKTA